MSMALLKAPYRRVDKTTHKVLDEVVYMTADMEDNLWWRRPMSLWMKKAV